MASARAMIERRRSSRVPIRIPVKVYHSITDGDLLDIPAEAVSVSQHGALLRAPFVPEVGARIEVLHGHSHELREFRVISVRRPVEEGLFELGVEIFHPMRDFWGALFPGKRYSS